MILINVRGFGDIGWIHDVLLNYVFVKCLAEQTKV